MPAVAVVDYGMGNLFSVQQACRQVGLDATITSAAADIEQAQAVILPGVGAFATAMDALKKLDLVHPLRDAATAGKPLIGICLGMQLLMTESYEFGRHRGLDLIPGQVLRLSDTAVKVPQIGWNRIHGRTHTWNDTLLRNVRDGEYMYFVHSFYCEPADAAVVLSTTRYGENEFSSSVQKDNIFACQFHPERSGRQGLTIYDSLRATLHKSTLAVVKS